MGFISRRRPRLRSIRRAVEKPGRRRCVREKAGRDDRQIFWQPGDFREYRLQTCDGPRLIERTAAGQPGVIVVLGEGRPPECHNGVGHEFVHNTMVLPSSTPTRNGSRSSLRHRKLCHPQATNPHAVDCLTQQAAGTPTRNEQNPSSFCSHLNPIEAYVRDRDLSPRRYLWKAEGQAILEKIQRAREAIQTESTV